VLAWPLYLSYSGQVALFADSLGLAAFYPAADRSSRTGFGGSGALLSRRGSRRSLG